jgi:hypothetical protein
MGRVLEHILDVALPGAKIPKPRASKRYPVVKWGTKRNGEDAMFYEIPSSKPGGKPTTKNISISTIKAVARYVEAHAEFTAEWFKRTFPDEHASAPCNFTTLGGLMELAGVVRYESRGRYMADSGQVA